MAFWWLSAGVAWGRSDDSAQACRAGVGRVEFGEASVELPLLRGPNTSFLPAVVGSVTTEAGVRPALVVVDLAGGCSRIDAATSRALGLALGDDGLVRLPALTLAGLKLSGVVARVDPDAPGLVLGVPSLGKVAAAVLPSEGIVVFTDDAGAEALLGRVGVALELPGRRDSGLLVPGAMRWGPVVVDGTFALRTDLRESHIVASPRLPEPVSRGGYAAWDVGTRLGDVWLEDTWIRSAEDGEGDDRVGALAYDVLFAVDLAVAPSRREVAFRTAAEDRSVDATIAAMAAATQRYAEEEKRAAGTADATAEPNDPRAVIGFDGPAPTRVPLGDPGNPVVRDRNLVLADTLWRAGLLEDALVSYFAAARYAGDHCGAHLDLALRRLAWSGTQRRTSDVVQKLVDDPLARAATLWGQWSELPETTRAAVRAGRAPPGGVQVEQPDSCALVFGWQHRLHPDQREALERDHDRDSGVAWSRVLGLLDRGDPAAAAVLLTRVDDSVPQLWRDLLALRLAAALREPERAEPRWHAIPGAPTDLPLVSALIVLDAATTTPHPDEWTRKLLRQDPRWVPAQLVHALATHEPPPPWSPVALSREPGSPQLRCQQAVHRALSGDAAGAARSLAAEPYPAEPDWWAASAVVAHVLGDRAARDRFLEELEWRFPLLPVDRLGLRDPVEPPARPPPPKPGRKP